jgi:hypothetical protein
VKHLLSEQEKSYLHTLPWGILERVCIPYLAQSQDPKSELPFTMDRRLLTAEQLAMQERFYNAQEKLKPIFPTPA